MESIVLDLVTVSLTIFQSSTIPFGYKSAIAPFSSSQFAKADGSSKGTSAFVSNTFSKFLDSVGTSLKMSSSMCDRIVSSLSIEGKHARFYF